MNHEHDRQLTPPDAVDRLTALQSDLGQFPYSPLLLPGLQAYNTFGAGNTLPPYIAEELPLAADGLRLPYDGELPKYTPLSPDDSPGFTREQ